MWIKRLNMKLKICKTLKKHLVALLFLCGAFNTIFLQAQQQKLFSGEYSFRKENNVPKFETAKAWNFLENAKREYDAGNLSEAVVLANKANDENKNFYLGIQTAIKKATNRKSILSLGDKITDVYNKLYEFGEYEVCKMLDEIFLTRSIKSFSNSMKNLYEYLEIRAETMPETAYLVGRVFEAQGEYAQAKNYYNKAWAQKDYLQTREYKLNILYSLSDVYTMLGKTKEAEKFLLAILASDKLYGSKNKYSSQLSAMLKNIKGEKNTKKFFLLYRHEGLQVLKATQMLTSLYLAEGNYEKALEVSACAVCIVTTELERYVKMKNFLFEYKNLSDLILKCENDIAITTWAEERKFWETYLQFADILYSLKFLAQAEDVYSAIGYSVPNYYLAQQAFYSIQKIRSLNTQEQNAQDVAKENEK